MTATTAIFKLDDGEDPGEAVVRVLKQLHTQEAQAIKGLTGCDLYQVEVLEVLKRSAFAANPKVGTKKKVSAKHLRFM